MLLLALAVGGVLGTLARFALGGWVQAQAGSPFPWGTLAVNALGSVVLGFVMRWSETAAVSPELRGLLTVGFCGAFTTFSTLAYETATMIQQGEWARAALYTFGSLAVGLAAVFAGISAAALTVRPGG
jgi:CrcB protein